LDLDWTLLGQLKRWVTSGNLPSWGKWKKLEVNITT